MDHHSSQNLEYSPNFSASKVRFVSNRGEDAGVHLGGRGFMSSISQPSLAGNNFDKMEHSSVENDYRKYNDEYNTFDENDGNKENDEKEMNCREPPSFEFIKSRKRSRMAQSRRNTSPNFYDTNNMYGNIEIGTDLKDASSKMRADLSKYKQELCEYTNTTKDLEEKYLRLNLELSRMQEKHKHFVSQRQSSNAAECASDLSSTGSEYSLRRKYTQIFQHYNEPAVPAETENQHKSRFADRKATLQGRRCRSNILMNNYDNKNYEESRGRSCHMRRGTSESKENPSLNKIADGSGAYRNTRTQGLKDIYKVLKNVIENKQNLGGAGFNANTKNNKIEKERFSVESNCKETENNIYQLKSTIGQLKSEQERYKTIITEQQSCLQDYHTRCVKATQIMQTQQKEIEKLNSNNRQLESEISIGMDQLRLKIESKLRKFNQIPQKIRDEQNKHERIVKDNAILCDRIRSIQLEADQLKVKVEDISKRKMATYNRLKTAERDLKIFKNYNASLKDERTKLTDELSKVRSEIDTMQSLNKRSLSRQREQSEKERRELQKRIFELEIKLSRNQNTTGTLLQERDTLIAELQSQLNTLVHNFEVSQKHIRVLRHHIYTLTAGNHSNSHSNSNSTPHIPTSTPSEPS